MRNKTPRIVFASIAAGGSHMSTAYAMKEAMERDYPGRYEIEVLDIMRAFGFGAYDSRHKTLWRHALANPWSIVLVQHMIDSAPRITNAALKIMLYDFAKEAAARFKASPPALVVANHGWTVVALTMAQQRFGLDVPVVSFETSTLNANALWAEPQAERFIVGSHVSKRRLARLGVPAGRIDVVGYPVRQSFLDAPSKRTARRRLEIDDRFTCLISLGGEGVGGALDPVFEALRALDPRVQIVLVAGRNHELYREANDMVDRFDSLFVTGFVNNMADYVAASDLVIGKTGPAAVYEILSVGRPMLVPRKSGLVENKMLGVLERNGIGWYTPHVEQIVERIEMFLDRPAALDEISEVTAGFDFPGMSARIARYLDAYAGKRSAPADACNNGLRFLHAAARRPAQPVVV